MDRRKYDLDLGYEGIYGKGLVGVLMALANWAVSIPLGVLFLFFTIIALLLLGPRWAIPIKARVREANQARAINDVDNALAASPTTI